MADLCVKLNEPYIVHARVRLEQWFMFSHACKKDQLFCQVHHTFSSLWYIDQVSFGLPLTLQITLRAHESSMCLFSTYTLQLVRLCIEVAFRKTSVRTVLFLAV